MIVFGQDADDGARDAVDRQRLIDDLRVAAKAPLPQPVAQDDDVIFAGRGFFGRKVAAQRRSGSQRLQQVGRDHITLHALRRVNAGKVRIPPTVERDLFE